MNKQYKLFIFDFDGTLGDTSECVVASFQGALTQNGMPAVERHEIVQLMGLSLPKVFQELTGGSLNDELCDQLVAGYRTLYRDLLTQKTRIFPGVKEMLEHLKQNGAICTIATSKKTEFAKLSCQYLEIDHCIDLYMGDDMVASKKPHPEMLESTLAQFDIDMADAVMIGDAATDIEMGNAIGMDTIAVTWGAHSERALRQLAPTYVVHEGRMLNNFVQAK